MEDIRGLSSIPGLGRSPGEGHGENPMDRGAWWTTVPKVAKSWVQLKQCSTHILLKSFETKFGKGKFIIFKDNF